MSNGEHAERIARLDERDKAITDRLDSYEARLDRFEDKVSAKLDALTSSRIETARTAGIVSILTTLVVGLFLALSAGAFG